MEADLKKLEVNLVNLAGQLASARHLIWQHNSTEIKQELRKIYIWKALFQVHILEWEFSRGGKMKFDIYIFQNPGEDFKPLVKVASGGELSRLSC